MYLSLSKFRSFATSVSCITKRHNTLSSLLRTTYTLTIRLLLTLYRLTTRMCCILLTQIYPSRQQYSLNLYLHKIYKMPYIDTRLTPTKDCLTTLYII
jgi:hypothetical protein